AGFLLSGIWALQTELAPTKPPPNAFSFNRLSLFAPYPVITHSITATPCITNTANRFLHRHSQQKNPNWFNYVFFIVFYTAG
ncbi:hypothetical protein ACT4JQ_002867, partial [Yersinia enterocolitica]